MLQQERINAFRDYIKDFLERHQIPGLTVALAKGEDIIYQEAFGYRDLARKKPATTDTIYGAASLTKLFTSTAIAQLVEQGLLSFDDPVTRHLPEFKLPGGEASEVTLRHLLTHTSGMPALDALQLSFSSHSSPDPADPSPVPLEEVPINTYADLLAYIAQYPGKPLGKPGAYFNYSNECYALLGAIVRRASKIPYAAFVRENILQPLGMYRTTFSFEEMYEYDDVTVLYDHEPKGTLRASTRWPCAPAFQPAGRIKSTAPELLKLFQVYAGKGQLAGTRILGEAGIAENMKPHQKYALHESYGHALIVRPGYHGVTLVGHGGMGKGISAYGGFVPEEGLSAVVLSNRSGVPAIQVFGAVMNLALGLPIDTPRIEYSPVEWQPDEAEKIMGTYNSAEGNEMSIGYIDNQLTFTQKGNNYPLKKLTGDTGLIEIKGFHQELKFYQDEEGQVIGLGQDVRFIPKALNMKHET